MKKIFSIFLCVYLCFSLSACNYKGLEKFSDYAFDYFDTVTTIIGYEKSEADFLKNCELIKSKLNEYHCLYNIYIKYNDIKNISTINNREFGSHTAVTVDKKIIDMLSYSKEMYNLTDGYLNIAMGSVLSIWHNYREHGLNNPQNAELPPIDLLTEASKHTDIEKLQIDKENNTVLLLDENMTLDVGAIAKGYAVEETALWMQKQGLNHYILNVGGNVRVIGTNSKNKTWKVGIENPDTDNKEKPYIEYLNLKNISLVTSGSYQRYYTVNGKNYHHIINPKTLMPAENFKSVSVLCENSAKADALSTALFCMTYNEGKKLVEAENGIEAMWVLNDGEKRYSSGFKKYCD